MRYFFPASLMLVLLLFSHPGSCDIAFVANIDGNWDLFKANDTGNNTVQLTQTAYDEKHPNWSADQKKIVYAASDGQLNIIDLLSKNAQTIVITDLKTPKISPCFSPDGRKITFAQFGPVSEGDDTDLFIYDLKSDSKRRLLDQYSLQMWPAWSPDGKQIAYTHMHCSAECGRMIQELWIADAHGKWARQLVMTHSFCQQPAWSPDGRKIAFSSDKSGNYDIWVVDLKKWEMDQFTTNAALDVKPAWSPDGKKLAFVSTRSGLMEIWIKELGSGRVKKLNPFGKRKIECKDVTW
jgi:TolB protein